jgi:uncharacterized protein (DUF488 family)
VNTFAISPFILCLQFRLESITGLLPAKEYMIKQIWTIGHSTRALENFIAPLKANEIKLVADVRVLPRSKRYPHFNKDALADSLGKVGMRYEHFPELGGRRRAKKDSSNTAWRNSAFRGYADHMETEEFRRGIERLLEVGAATGATAIMCAEAVWWRCHRALVSDFLKALGIIVTHIIDATKTESHPFTSAARIVEGELTYHIG